jgi:hypothetical protein
MEMHITDPFPAVEENPEQFVTAVLAHPLHGRLVERVILWVRPTLDFKGAHYELTWWGNGVAYYKAKS